MRLPFLNTRSKPQTHLTKTQQNNFASFWICNEHACFCTEALECPRHKENSREQDLNVRFKTSDRFAQTLRQIASIDTVGLVLLSSISVELFCSERNDLISINPPLHAKRFYTCRRIPLTHHLSCHPFISIEDSYRFSKTQSEVVCCGFDSTFHLRKENRPHLKVIWYCQLSLIYPLLFNKYFGCAHFIWLSVPWFLHDSTSDKIQSGICLNYGSPNKSMTVCK